jgi:hypothetical protein
MRSFGLIEGDRTTMLHVTPGSAVTVFDSDREDAIREQIAMPVNRGATYGRRTWRLLSYIMESLACAEDLLLRIDRLVERSKTG